MKFSIHFERDVLPKRPYLTEELLYGIINDPLRLENQDDGRIKIWGFSSEHNKYVMVILLEDRITIHTAFFDRDYKE